MTTRIQSLDDRQQERQDLPRFQSSPHRLQVSPCLAGCQAVGTSRTELISLTQSERGSFHNSLSRVCCADAFFSDALDDMAANCGNAKMASRNRRPSLASYSHSATRSIISRFNSTLDRSLFLPSITWHPLQNPPKRPLAAKRKRFSTRRHGKQDSSCEKLTEQTS